MELTQAHFDKQFEELNKRLDNMATKAELEAIRSEMVTKADLSAALKNQTQELEDYTDAVGQTILEAVDGGFNKINRRFDERDKRHETVEKDIRQIKRAVNLS